MWVNKMLNYVYRVRLVTAELNCEQEPSALELARVFASRFKTTELTGSQTPRGAKGSHSR